MGSPPQAIWSASSTCHHKSKDKEGKCWDRTHHNYPIHSICGSTTGFFSRLLHLEVPDHHIHHGDILYEACGTKGPHRHGGAKGKHGRSYRFTTNPLPVISLCLVSGCLAGHQRDLLPWTEVNGEPSDKTLCTPSVDIHHGIARPTSIQYQVGDTRIDNHPAPKK